MTDIPDRIERRVVLRAPRARVWGAISDSRQFGAWFGADFDGPFVPGARLGGAIRPTTVDPEVARLQEPHRGARFEILVERLEPERLLSFRWQPGLEPGATLTPETSTLVEFALEAVDGGTAVTITESGFERIPLAKRAQAFQGNQEGWGHQARLLDTYVQRHGA